MEDDPKTKLISSIKEYVSFDRQIKERQNEIKMLKQRQKEVSSNLVEVMRSKEIDCFEINNGRILYKKSKTKKAISNGFLKVILDKYFDGNQETHFKVILNGTNKKITSRLLIHKKINQLLKEEFNCGLHSLEIKLLA